MFGIDDAITAGLGVLSGGLTNKWAGNSAQHAMDFSASQQLVSEDFNREEAQKTRDWQQQMRATQYQTATADMQKAGLNPMLAYSQGGAGTPSGATASVGTGAGGTAAPVRDVLDNASTAAQIQLITANADKAQSEADLNRENLPVVRGQVGLQNAQMALLREQAERTAHWTDLTIAEKDLVLQNIKNAIRTGENIEANTANTKVNTVLRQLDVPEARNKAAAQNSWYMKNVMPYTGEAVKIGSAAAALRYGLGGGRGATTINKGPTNVYNGAAGSGIRP